MLRLASVGIVHKVKERVRFRRTQGKGKYTQKPTIVNQACHVFEKRMVGNPMMVIHAKADRCKDNLFLRGCAGRDCRNGVFDDGSQAWLVTKENAVRTTIDQQAQIDVVAFHDQPVRRAQRAHA